jgi:hypothetical protein
MKMKPAILIVLIFALSPESVAQKKVASHFNFDIGITGRTTIFYHKGTDGLPSGPLRIYDVAYDYRAGVNGTGINFSVGYDLLKEEKLSLRIASTVRYDHFFLYNKTWYFDGAATITKSVGRKSFVGVGTTLYNIGKELKYRVNNEEKTLPLEFHSLDLFFGVPVWVLFVEPKISLVQEDFPGPIKDNAMLLGVRVFYRFPREENPEE